MENNLMDDLHSFTLCFDDWQLVIAALRATAAEQLEKAHRVGLESTYGAVLYVDGQKYRAIAEHLEFHLPESDD